MVLSVGCRDHLIMQLCMQKVLAMAVRTVMMKLMMVLMFSFFIVVVGLMVTQSCGGGWLHNRGRRAMDALSRYPFMTVFHWCLLEVSHRWNSWCDQPGWSSEYP